MAQTLKVDWTPEMKSALIDGVRRNQSMNSIARRIGVSTSTLAHGALAIVRDLSGLYEQHEIAP